MFVDVDAEQEAEASEAVSILSGNPEDVNSDTELSTDEKIAARNAAMRIVDSNPLSKGEDNSFHDNRFNRQPLGAKGLKLFMDQGDGARAAASSPMLAFEVGRQEFEAKKKKRMMEEQHREIGTAHEKHLLKEWLRWRQQLLKLLSKQWDRSNIPLILVEEVSRHLPDTPSQGGMEDKEKTTNRDIIMLMKDMAELQALLTGKLQRHFDKTVKSYVIEHQYSGHYKRRIKAKLQEIQNRNKLQEKDRKRKSKASEAHRNRMDVMQSGATVLDVELMGLNKSTADLFSEEDIAQSDAEEKQDSGPQFNHAAASASASSARVARAAAAASDSDEMDE